MNRKSFTLTSIFIITTMMLSACSVSIAPLTTSTQPKSSALSPAATSAPAVVAATPTSNSQPAIIQADPSLEAYQNALESIYQNVNQSVVSIQVTKKVTAVDPSTLFPNGLFPNGRVPNQYEYAQGSGFVWDNQGNIVTNNHVVSDATRITVTFADGKKYEAKVSGTDVSVDLAVVKVVAPATELHPVALGDSNQVKVGQLAIAIGNPFGLEDTMTVGVVSAIGRSIPSDNSSTASTSGSYTIPDVIQTDAPINPGNSGGVLVDIQGKVIGVTSAIESTGGSSAGVGFAIPAAIVWKVVPTLIQGGKVDHTWLGLTGTTMSPEIAKLMNLPSDQTGILVVDVTSGSPAEKAGLKGSSQTVTFEGQDIQIGGDVITAIDQKPVKVFEDLVTYLLSSTEVGQTVTLSLMRDGKAMDVKAVLEARPAVAPTQTSQNPTTPQNQAVVWLGITGGSMTAEISKAMNLPDTTQGVLVVDVTNDSPASTAGLKGGTNVITINGQSIKIGGDVITAVDGQPITSMDDLSGMLQNYQPGDVAEFSILRNGMDISVKVTLAAKP